jgi:uncharacterized protein
MGGDMLLLVQLGLALLVTGLAAGLLAGLLGVGGGIVMVPVMFHIFTLLGVDEDVRMHMAVGTSLLTMIPTSIRSALAHHRKGSVDIPLLKRWGPAALLGTASGSLLAARIDGEFLLGIFGVVALLVSLHMALGEESWSIADALPGWIGQSLMAFLIAGISVMMGIGGGTLSVPTLTLFRYPIHRAVGTAAAIGLFIAIPGAVGFIWGGVGVEERPPYSLGYASLIGFACMVPMTIIAAPWGAALAHKLNTLWLRRAFALFLALTGLRMVMSL